MNEVLAEHHGVAESAVGREGSQRFAPPLAGDLVDGDELLFIIALSRQQQGVLSGGVVGTLMSNLGLEHALQGLGIEFRRARVGDRYVLEALKQGGGVIGGETSGHMIVLDQTTTTAFAALIRVSISREYSTPPARSLSHHVE